jgi:hypothetical protein
MIESVTAPRHNGHQTTREQASGGQVSTMMITLSLEIDTGGHEPALVWDWSYTSNAAPMWKAAGADLADFEGRLAGECLPFLRHAAQQLRIHVERFDAMNPPNGWGSRESLVDALGRLTEAFERHPGCSVRVSL